MYIYLLRRLLLRVVFLREKVQRCVVVFEDYAVSSYTYLKVLVEKLPLLLYFSAPLLVEFTIRLLCWLILFLSKIFSVFELLFLLIYRTFMWDVISASYVTISILDSGSFYLCSYLFFLECLSKYLIIIWYVSGSHNIILMTCIYVRTESMFNFVKGWVTRRGDKFSSCDVCTVIVCRREGLMCDGKEGFIDKTKRK